MNVWERVPTESGVQVGEWICKNGHIQPSYLNCVQGDDSGCDQREERAIWKPSFGPKFTLDL